MLTVEHNIAINRPVEQAWNFLTDFKNTPKWDLGVHETRKTSAGPTGLGMTFQNIGPFLGRESVREYEVTEYEPNKKVTVKLITPVKYIRQAEVSYTFEPTQSGTILISTGGIEFSGFFKLLQPILLKRAKKSGQGDLANLKRIIEAQPNT